MTPEDLFEKSLIATIILIIIITAFSVIGAEEIETYTVGMEITGKVINNHETCLVMSGSGEYGIVKTSEEVFCNSRIGEILEVEVKVIKLVGGEIVKEFEIRG